MPHEVDPILAGLVTAADTGGFEVDINLWVSGAVISGVLTGIASWSTGLGDLIREHPAGLYMADIFSEAPARYGQLDDDEKGELSDRGHRLAIHLRDAWPAGHAPPPAGGFLWRGLLSEIDAWSLGRLMPSPSI